MSLRYEKEGENVTNNCSSNSSCCRSSVIYGCLCHQGFLHHDTDIDTTERDEEDDEELRSLNLEGKELSLNLLLFIIFFVC